MSLLDDELEERLRAHREKDPNRMTTSIEHRFLDQSDIREAFGRVLQAMEQPLIDTCGISHTGHVTALAELLGRVARDVSNIAEPEDGDEAIHRDALLNDLAWLCESAIAFMTDELRARRAKSGE